MQMRYCLMWQSNINSFHVHVSLSVLGASPNPEMFLWFYSNDSLWIFCFCSHWSLLKAVLFCWVYVSDLPCMLFAHLQVNIWIKTVFFPSEVYDIQGNLQDGSQVVVSVIFENKCDSFLKSMEFNVLDSLNSKLQRPEGSGPHDGLTVPFQLPPGLWFSTNAVCNEWANFRNAELCSVFCLIM